MTTLKNFFRNKSVPGLFGTLAYNQESATVAITSTDPAYYAIRSLNEKEADQNLLVTEFTDPFTATFVDPSKYALVDLNVSGSTPQLRKEIQEELNYLNRLRLVKQKDDNTYYVSSLAVFLYNDQGLFSLYSDSLTQQMKLNYITPLVTLLVTYTLPGYYWQAYYAKPRLPTMISATGKLQTVLTEVEALWKELRDHFEPALPISLEEEEEDD